MAKGPIHNIPHRLTLRLLLFSHRNLPVKCLRSRGTGGTKRRRLQQIYCNYFKMFTYMFKVWTQCCVGLIDRAEYIYSRSIFLVKECFSKILWQVLQPRMRHPEKWRQICAARLALDSNNTTPLYYVLSYNHPSPLTVTIMYTRVRLLRNGESVEKTCHLTPTTCHVFNAAPLSRASEKQRNATCTVNCYDHRLQYIFFITIESS